MRNNSESNLIGSFQMFSMRIQTVNNRKYVCYFHLGNCQTGFCLLSSSFVNTAFEFILNQGHYYELVESLK